MLEVCADVNAALSEVPQVTMAAVGGACLAGGAQLAASCDLVLAHEGASFCLPGVRSPGGFCHTPAVAVGARLAPHKALELALLALYATACSLPPLDPGLTVCPNGSRRVRRVAKRSDVIHCGPKGRCSLKGKLGQRVLEPHRSLHVRANKLLLSDQ